MKKVLLTLLVVATTGFSSMASNELTDPTKVKNSKSVSTVALTTKSFSVLENSTKVIIQQKVNTFCKLIQLGELEAVQNLIDNGTNVNQKSCGMTPLMYAARQNKSEIVDLLISRGAKLKIKSDKGMTALQYAEQSKATECYNLIVKAINV